MIMKGLKRDISLAFYTTLRIGGPARYFFQARTEERLKEAVRWAGGKKIPWMVIGSGSNLLISDRGFPGLIIRNNVAGIKSSGQNLAVKGGAILQDLVDFANQAGLGGLEKMTGIPGTVAGAVYGNAGAYGQSISDRLVRVKVFDGRDEKSFRRNRCRFSYRESIFKEKKDLIILEAEFRLERAAPQDLQAVSQEIRLLREKKYPAGLKCPGSFFKNLRVEDLPPRTRAKVPKDKIVHGKVPAGYLLEEVGAKGKSRGGVKIASYHGNLFFNEGGGTAEDFMALAEKYRQKVNERFDVLLEPEVQLVGFEKP
jgi:UDP-N-acetylmuramate dehydrogenase